MPEGRSQNDDLKDHQNLFWNHLLPALMISVSLGGYDAGFENGRTIRQGMNVPLDSDPGR